MKKIVLFLVAIVLLILTLISCASCTPPAEETQTETPSITVLSPNDGEVWKMGEFALVENIEHRAMIRWKVNGVFPDNYFGVIKLKKGDTVIRTISAVPISPPWNKPEHSWMPWTHIQNLEEGNDYSIEIVPVISEKSDYWSIEMEEVIGGIGDTSDNYFSIIRSEQEPSITVLSPNSEKESQRVHAQGFNVSVNPLEINTSRLTNYQVAPGEEVIIVCRVKNHSYRTEEVIYNFRSDYDLGGIEAIIDYDGPFGPKIPEGYNWNKVPVRYGEEQYLYVSFVMPATWEEEISFTITVDRNLGPRG